MSLIFPPRPEDFKFAEAKSPRLRIITYSDAIREINVRGITKTGLIHDYYVTTDDRLFQNRFVPLTEIPLTIQVCTSTPNTQRGQLYCQIFLEFSGVPACTLASNYITSCCPLSWPGSSSSASTEGPGAILELILLDPEVGQNFIYTVPANTLLKLVSISFCLRTSDTPATRESILLVYSTVGTYILIARPTITQLASLTNYYSFCNYTIIPSAFSDIICGHIPTLPFITNSYLASNIINIQTKDQISQVILSIEQWLNP